MRRAWRAALTALTAVGLAATGALPAGAAAPSVGGDASWPQCGRPLSFGLAFGIVGVNKGDAISTNPCLADQLAWAASSTGTGHPSVEVYVNTANPGPKRAAWWPSGDATRSGAPARSPYGPCSGGATRACAWVYGSSLAVDDLEQRGVPSGAAARWWLDVEVANTWSGDTARNRAVLEGMTRRFTGAGQKVGLYALDHEFRDLIGAVPASSVLHPLPTWLAGAKDQAHAAQVCTRAPLAGGRVQLVQWIGSDAAGAIDQDLACGVLTRSSKPTVAGAKRVGATLTAKAGSWAPRGVRFAYRWTRDGATIDGATGRTYRAGKQDRGHRLAVVVTGTLAGYSRAMRTSASSRIG